MKYGGAVSDGVEAAGCVCGIRDGPARSCGMVDSMEEGDQPNGDVEALELDGEMV